MKKETKKRTKLAEFDGKKFVKDTAIKMGEDWFEVVIKRLKSTIEDVERHRRGWRNAIKDKPYPDGSKRPDWAKVQQLEFCLSTLRQIDFKYEDAIRASIELSHVFKTGTRWATTEYNL